MAQTEAKTMKQEIIIDKPPIFDELLKVFPEAGEPGVIFSWGDKIYNPSGYPIPPQLMAHEAVHGERQIGAIDADGDIDGFVRGWWASYMKEPHFRLQEEILAHRVEYKEYCKLTKDREQRVRYLHRMCIRLAGVLYGNLITYMDARRAITK